MAKAHSESRNPFGAAPKPVGDFFAPFFKVEFITARTADGRRIQNGEEVEAPSGGFFGKIGATIQSYLDSQIRVSLDNAVEQLRNYSTNLTIRTLPGTSTATLVMEPPYEDALRLIDHRAIQYDSVMRVEWGWLPSTPGDEAISSGAHFYALQPPEMSVNNGDVQITLTGVELFAHNYSSREGRRTWPRSQFRTDLSIVEALLSPLGFDADTTLVPENIERDGKEVPHPLRAQKGTSETRPVEGSGGRQVVRTVNGKIEQNERTWVFFNRLIRGNNCDYFMSGKKCFIVDRNHAKIQRPSYTLAHYQQMTSDKHIPMFNWSTNALKTLFTCPPSARGITYASNDPDTGEANEATFDPAASSLEEFIGKRTRSGRANPNGISMKIGDITLTPNLAMEDTDRGRHISQPASAVNADERARQSARQASMIANTAASVTIPGMPNLTPWQVVRVEGVPSVFKGNYLIKEVTHTFSTGDGFSTELQLVRDTSTGDDATGNGLRPQTGGNQPKAETGSGEGANATVHGDGG